MGGLNSDDRKALEARCASIVATVPVPEPFDVAELCRLVGEQRGRRLRLTAEPLGITGSGPCGMLIGLEHEDIILVEQRTSALHQEHIALHEVGHILCGHDDVAAGLGREEALRLMPSLDPDMVRRVLGRTSYDAPQEQEAEMVATLLGERVQGRSTERSVQPSLGDDAGDGLRRLTQALGGMDL